MTLTFFLSRDLAQVVSQSAMQQPNRLVLQTEIPINRGKDEKCRETGAKMNISNGKPYSGQSSAVKLESPLIDVDIRDLLKVVLSAIQILLGASTKFYKPCNMLKIHIHKQP